EEKTGELYGKRKVDVEPVFGFLKANLRFSRMSVRGKEKVKNELGFAFMAVNLRKFTTMNAKTSWAYNKTKQKKGTKPYFLWLVPFLRYFRLVMSQPLSLNFVLFSPKHRRPFESMSDGFANSAIEFANLNESFAKSSSYFAKHRNYSASPITFR
ncbi:transposase, partial [Piscibacillus halophilus]